MVKVIKHIKKDKKKKKKIVRKQPIKTAPQQQKPNIDQTTLRNMLLQRAGLITTGFSPQQYGNVNDKINTLQATESTMRQENMRQKQQIEVLNKNIIELRKEKHEVDKTHYRAENEYDMLRVKLDEAERVKGKTDVLKEQIDNLTKQMNELEVKESINKLVLQRDTQKALYDKTLLENQFLTEEIESNKLKAESDKLAAERDNIVARNKGMQAYIESPEFKQPQQALIDRYKEIAQENAKKQKENISLQLMKAAQEAQSYELSKEEQEALQKQITANAKLQKEIDDCNEQKNKYYYHKQRINKLSRKTDDLTDERDTIKSTIDLLDPKDLSQDIKDQVKSFAQAESDRNQAQGRLDIVKQERKSKIAKETSQAMFNFMSSPKYQQQEDYIASKIMQKARYDELARQYELMKAAKQQEIRSSNAAYASKRVTMEDIGALPEQIKDMEKAIDDLNQKEEQITKDYREKDLRKRKLLEQLLDKQEEKTSFNPNDTIDNYLMEKDPWFGDIRDTDSHEESDYKSLIKAYSNWHKPKKEEWSEQDTNNNNNSNNNDDWGNSSENQPNNQDE